MAGLSQQFGDTAARLLTQFGVSVSLSRSTPGTYNPATGESSQTVASLSGVGVKVPVKAREANGTTIQVGDLRLIYRGDKIQTGDTLGGYRVASVEDLNPDDSGLIIQKAILRR